MANLYDSDFSDDDLSPLDENFNLASGHVRKLTGKLSNDQLLELYGLYKQGTEGKCNTARPGWLDGKGRKKWDAWNSRKDLTTDEAKVKYIELVQELDPELSLADPGDKETWIAVSSLRWTPEPELVVNEMTVLEAARENCGDRLAQLLKDDPRLKDEVDECRLSILHWAADRDATDALTVAIAAGCDLNSVDESGLTPLHYSVFCGHENATKILLKAGASKNIEDSSGNTPKDLAEDEIIINMLSEI